MPNYPGVYTTKKKDGTPSYRASITHNNKHVSLGSYEDVKIACEVYSLATKVLKSSIYHLNDYHLSMPLPYSKWVILHNYRDHGYYFRTPIYMHPSYFVYHLDQKTKLYFDVDDLFYYSSHKIHRRGGYLFVNDYGMQINILSRYGIRNHAVINVDYQFIDGNPNNFRYDNVEVINPYSGIEIEKNGSALIYKARIHLRGNYIIGRYSDIHMAAIAYNKAVDHINIHQISNKNFEKNFIHHMSSEHYRECYDRIALPSNITTLPRLTD